MSQHQIGGEPQIVGQQRLDRVVLHQRGVPTGRLAEVADVLTFRFPLTGLADIRPLSEAEEVLAVDLGRMREWTREQRQKQHKDRSDFEPSAHRAVRTRDVRGA